MNTSGREQKNDSSATPMPPLPLERLQSENRILRQQVEKAKSIIEGQLPHILALEEKLAARTRELDELKLESDRSLHTLCHDLKSALRVIDGFSHALSEDPESWSKAELLEFYRKINFFARRAGHDIQNLIVSNEVVRSKFQMEPTNLSLLVSQVCAELKATVNTQAIDWKMTELPVVPVDERWMKHVFRTVLSNALEFTRAHKVASVGISFDNADSESRITIMVERSAREENVQPVAFRGVSLIVAEQIVRRHAGQWSATESEDRLKVVFTLSR
jgi:light-regulated signal transduction histidine kinase (bacteriophytochrome)